MLLIEKNHKNKLEWIVLPTLPSKVQAIEEEIGISSNLQKF
jgi:hypothetical protein